MEAEKVSAACSSSAWKASSESSGMKAWASSNDCMKEVSVLMIEVRIRSTSFELMSATSSGVEVLIAWNLSRAFVIAPVHPARDLLTEERSVGFLLLPNIRECVATILFKNG